MKKFLLLKIVFFTAVAPLMTSCGDSNDSGYKRYYINYGNDSYEIVGVWKKQTEVEISGQTKISHELRFYNQNALDRGTYTVSLTMLSDKFGNRLDVTSPDTGWNLEFRGGTGNEQYLRVDGGNLTGKIKSGTVSMAQAGSMADAAVNVVVADDQLGDTQLTVYYKGAFNLWEEGMDW